MEIKQEVLDQLRTYQKIDIATLIERKGGLVFHDMRLGKTLITLVANHKLDGYPCLIVCPKFALYVWQQEIEKWLGLKSLVYTGKPKERKMLWQQFLSGDFPFLITNYAMLKEINQFTEDGDVPGLWKAFIADEIHMGGLLNHKSKTAGFAENMAGRVKYKYLLTGTPIRQGVTDLYEPLHIMQPGKFRSYWQFVNKYCIVLEGPFGKEIERTPKDVSLFRDMLKQYMVRRKKEEVFTSLPPKQRMAVPLLMEKAQQKVYEELSEDLIALIKNTDTGEENILAVPGVLPLMMRQRQLLVCPQVLGLSEKGAAIEALVEMSDDLFQNKEPFIVFSPFRGALKYAEEALREKYSFKSYYIQGGMSAEELRESWTGFQENKKDNKVMFCIIRSAASFKASAASIGFFLGSEWDFNLNTQAEDRMFDPSKQNATQIHYMLYKDDTVDANILSKLNAKQFASDFIIESDEIYKDIEDKLKGRRTR